jgi:predicted Zn-ribbon and HTH transcriptional regulator
VRRHAKEPPVPHDRGETVRQTLLSILIKGKHSVRDLSVSARISEKEVLSHLDHIQKSVKKTGRSLEISPAQCRKCGFLFKKRERLKKPGKCPVCRGETIREPLFYVE